MFSSQSPPFLCCIRSHCCGHFSISFNMLCALSTIVCFTYLLAVAYVYFRCCIHCRCNWQISVLLAGLDQCTLNHSLKGTLWYQKLQLSYFNISQASYYWYYGLPCVASPLRSADQSIQKPIGLSLIFDNTDLNCAYRY